MLNPFPRYCALIEEARYEEHRPMCFKVHELAAIFFSLSYLVILIGDQIVMVVSGAPHYSLGQLETATELAKCFDA